MNHIINIELNKKEDYINKFNNKRISADLDNYILNETKTVKLTDKITIEIDSKSKLTEEEQKNLVSMIKLSYKDDLDELLIYEKKIISKAIILMLIGVIILLAYYLSNNLFFVSEFILIIGWLMIWEAADGLIFSRTDNRMKQTRRKQLIHSNIYFR